MDELIRASELLRLREWTDARIALGRVGASMPTKANLDFEADHASARDAVHSKLNVTNLAHELEAAGFSTLSVRSQAESRAEYLRRPDLGRLLHPSCCATLQCDPLPRRLTVVIGDGLSAEAPQRYAVPLLQQLRPLLPDWTMDSIVIAEQARVALGDEIGSLRSAEAVLVLLGERPGLKAADSLGAYLTYSPRVGLTDASRNCVSNIREGGLSISSAVTKLVYLLNGARALGQSGVVLKDNSESPQLIDPLSARKSLGLNDD
jgi:ethanolamine ammonia-lyase small subunit